MDWEDSHKKGWRGNDECVVGERRSLIKNECATEEEECWKWDASSSRWSDHEDSHVFMNRCVCRHSKPHLTQAKINNILLLGASVVPKAPQTIHKPNASSQGPKPPHLSDWKEGERVEGLLSPCCFILYKKNRDKKKRQKPCNMLACTFLSLRTCIFSLIKEKNNPAQKGHEIACLEREKQRKKKKIWVFQAHKASVTSKNLKVNQTRAFLLAT